MRTNQWRRKQQILLLVLIHNISGDMNVRMSMPYSREEKRSKFPVRQFTWRLALAFVCVCVGDTIISIRRENFPFSHTRWANTFSNGTRSKAVCKWLFSILSVFLLFIFLRSFDVNAFYFSYFSIWYFEFSGPMNSTGLSLSPFLSPPSSLFFLLGNCRRINQKHFFFHISSCCLGI